MDWIFENIISLTDKRMQEEQLQRDEDLASEKFVNALSKLEEMEQQFVDDGYDYMQIANPYWWFVNDDDEIEGPFSLETMRQMYSETCFTDTTPIMFSHWSAFYQLQKVYTDKTNVFHAMVSEPESGEEIYTPAQLQRLEAANTPALSVKSATDEQQTQMKKGAERRYFRMVYEICTAYDQEDDNQDEDNEEEGGYEEAESEVENMEDATAAGEKEEGEV